MMNKPLFGPAGNSDSFTKAYKGSVHAPKWLKELGLTPMQTIPLRKIT